MAKIKTQVTALAGQDVEKEDHSSIACGIENWSTILEINLEIPKKIGNRYTLKPSYTTLGHVHKRCPTMTQRHLVFHYVQSGLVCDSHKLETNQIPHNGRTDTDIWFIFTMEYYSSIENNDIMSFAGKWTELENSILSEVTQTQKGHA